MLRAVWTLDDALWRGDPNEGRYGSRAWPGSADSHAVQINASTIASRMTASNCLECTSARSAPAAIRQIGQ